MMKGHFVRFALVACILSMGASGAFAFQKGGCGDGECRDCHQMTRDEAVRLLAGTPVDNVVDVGMSQVQGLWEVVVERGGKKYPLYIDFSKDFLVNGQIIRLSTKENVTGARYESLNVGMTDPSRIPLAGALVLGKPSARRKVIVFSDPDCHFCGLLHEAMKTVVAKVPDVAFHIKLYSRNNNPAAMEKARAVVCAQSLKLLEDAYAKKPIPAPACASKEPEEALKLSETLNIRGTPTMVLPDGRIMVGYRDADALLKMLEGVKGTTKK